MKRVLGLVVLVGLLGCRPAAKQTWAQWSEARSAVGVEMVAGPMGDAWRRPAWTVDVAGVSWATGYGWGDAARVGDGFNLAARHPGFPATRIAAVHIDINRGDARLSLVWEGPDAAEGPVGPWPATIGRGGPGFDCDDVVDSNTVDSYCTPKGVFPVVGFADHLRAVPVAEYVTWVVYEPRYVAIHSFYHLPRYAASAGCIRVGEGPAKLIHNNALAGETRVHIFGEWVEGEAGRWP